MIIWGGREKGSPTWVTKKVRCRCRLQDGGTCTFDFADEMRVTSVAVARWKVSEQSTTALLKQDRHTAITLQPIRVHCLSTPLFGYLPFCLSGLFHNDETANSHWIRPCSLVAHLCLAQQLLTRSPHILMATSASSGDLLK